MFRQDFSCPALLVPTLFPLLNFRVRGYHPLWPDFPDCSTNSEAKGCRLLRVRSPLLAESRLISFPPATQMFQFTGFALPKLCIHLGMTQRAGFPHSDIFGSKLYCQLPEAFRRLTRLSSPVIAKASIICTYSLDPIILSPPQKTNITSISLSRVCDTASIRLA